MTKKLKYYIIILTILWSGTIFQNLTGSASASVLQKPVVLLQDTYAGNLTVEERQQIAYRLLSYFDASIVDSVEKDQLFTIYAHTDLIEQGIMVENHLINLNLLYTYNEQTDETTLIVATPLYNEDF